MTHEEALAVIRQVRELELKDACDPCTPCTPPGCAVRAEALAVAIADMEAIEPMRRAVQNAWAGLSVASIRSLPTDDPIVIGYMRDAIAELRKVLP
jgi:hypothetical protein